MERVVKLEVKRGWGEVETIKIGRVQRRVLGLTAEEVGSRSWRTKSCLANSRA